MSNKSSYSDLSPTEFFQRESIDRAIAAYLRWSRRHGIVEQQPSRTLSYVDRDGEIVLKNVRGELARYCIHNGGLPYEFDRGRLVRLSYR